MNFSELFLATVLCWSHCNMNYTIFYDWYSIARKNEQKKIDNTKVIFVFMYIFIQVFMHEMNGKIHVEPLAKRG